MERSQKNLQESNLAQFEEMSVEKASAEEAQSTVPVSNIETTRQGESDGQRQMGVGLVDGKIQEGTQEGVAVAVTDSEFGKSENTAPSPVSNAVKVWFQSLNAEERCAAATFADGAFLSSLLAFAVPWSGTALDQPQSTGEYCVYMPSTLFRVLLLIEPQDFCGHGSRNPRRMANESGVRLLRWSSLSVMYSLNLFLLVCLIRSGLVNDGFSGGI